MGTTVGRGLKLDAGLVEKYPPDVLGLLNFRFLGRAPNFVAVSPSGQLEMVGRADREVVCSPEVPDAGSRDHDDGLLCQVRLDVAVQPMKYFDIIKARIVRTADYVSNRVGDCQQIRRMNYEVHVARIPLIDAINTVH